MFSHYLIMTIKDINAFNILNTHGIHYSDTYNHKYEDKQND